MVKVRLLQGNALELLKTLPDRSVHCVVTSIPYWGLRDYGLEPQVWGGDEGCGHEWGEEKMLTKGGKNQQKGLKGNIHIAETWDSSQELKQGQFCSLCGAWRGSYGLEPTIELYVEHTVAIFREVRRVLRGDGVLFLNLGDSYFGGGGAHKDYHASPGLSKSAARNGVPGCIGKAVAFNDGPNRQLHPGLKPKDLCGVPWRVALALQADGWWLRSDIIWAKPNPMPESCTDRPTSAHEHIFLLTKSAKYFWDAEAVRETSTGQNDHDLTGPGYHAPGQSPNSGSRKVKMPDGWATHLGGHGSFHKEGREAGAPGFIRSGRNLRSVWTIATAPFPQAHFATFPPAIPERCIKAGTSEKGCCPKCGAAWRRVVEKETQEPPYRKGNKPEVLHAYHGESNTRTLGMVQNATTTGWIPTCGCNAGEPQPCTVLDPFSGAGTTALVAAKLGRDAIGIELNPEYVEISRKRIAGEMGMLVEISVDTPGESRGEIERGLGW